VLIAYFGDLFRERPDVELIPFPVSHAEDTRLQAEFRVSRLLQRHGLRCFGRTGDVGNPERYPKTCLPVGKLIGVDRREFGGSGAVAKIPRYFPSLSGKSRSELHGKVAHIPDPETHPETFG